jgi:hypothetical protein
MGRVKEMYSKMSQEDAAYKLSLVEQWQEELVDPKIPETLKRTILKNILH